MCNVQCTMYIHEYESCNKFEAAKLLTHLTNRHRTREKEGETVNIFLQ